MFKKILFLVLAAQPALAVALSDPTRPGDYGAHAAADSTGNAPLLVTVIRLGSHPLAVINGVTLHPGDSIQGYRLLELRPDHVVLGDGGGHLVLPLVASLRRTSLQAPQVHHDDQDDQ